MAANDDAQILQIPLRAEGVKSDDWAKVRASDLTALNDVLREMQERYFKLAGRTGDAAIHSGLSVSGGITSGGGLSGTNLTLGADSLTPSDPSFAPLVETALTPQALDYAPVLGATADLRTASPFTWTLSEHFLGGGQVGTGDIGELGWSLAGTAGVGVLASVPSHPGVVSIDTAGSALTALYLQAPLQQGDLRYLAWVVQLPTAFRRQMSVGFRDVLTSGTGSVGAYFAYGFGTSPNWQTVTSSAAGSSINTTSVVVTDGAWVLLEIVFGEDFVDFFLNRTRLFRHTGVSVDLTTEAFIASVQEQGPNDTTVYHDRCVVSGRGRNLIWTA